MPRPPRLTYAHAVHHVTLRCNNREFLFSEPTFELFRNILQQARARFPILIYNYCLMTNHAHLFYEVGADDTLSKAMHWIAATFSRSFNRATGRVGHLWGGRFRSAIIEEDSYFLRCMAYVDLNPVRAGLVASPAEYRWCGHKALQTQDTRELDFHPLYLDLGPNAQARYDAYMDVLAQEAARPRHSLTRDYFIGTPEFVKRMLARFGLNEGRFIRREPLDDGIVCAVPRIGRIRRRDEA